MLIPPLSSPPFSGGGQDLQSIPAFARSARAGTSDASPMGTPIAHIFEAHRYANLIEQFFTATPGVSTIALDQSPTPRNMLILRNTSTTDNIFITFGKAASIVSAIALQPGTPWGQLILWDVTVPQGDMWIFSTAAVTLAFAYSTLGDL